MKRPKLNIPNLTQILQQHLLTIDTLAIAIIIVLPFLVFWRLWAPNSADRLILRGDILAQAYASRLFVHEQMMLQGEWPLWNPYQFGGMPLLGDVQVAVFYLPNLVLDWLYASQPLTYFGFEALAIAHYAIAGVLMYAYLRGLGLTSLPALCGAIAFEFNGFFIGHRGHYNMLAVVVWIPGVLWALDQAWRNHQGDKNFNAPPNLSQNHRGAGFFSWFRIAWVSIAALFLSQMIMAGHPQLTFYSTIFIISYFLYRWAQLGKQSLPENHTWRDYLTVRFLRVPLSFTMMGLLATGISMITLLPTAELLTRSARSDLSYEFVAQFAFLPRNIISLFIPEFLNWSGTEFRIYAGILTLTLALVAWVVPQQPRPERAFFSMVIIVATIGAMGAFTAWHGLAYRFIPGFSSIRVSARMFFFANFGLAVLAAFGTEIISQTLSTVELNRLHKIIRIHSWTIGITIILATVLYLILMWHYQPVGEEFYKYAQHFPLNRLLETGELGRYNMLTQTINGVLLFGFFLSLSGLIIWLRAKERLMGISLMIAVIGVMFLDLATYAPDHDTFPADIENDTLAMSDFSIEVLLPWQVEEQKTLIEHLQSLPPTSRIDNSEQVLADNYSQQWHIPSSTGYNILNLKYREDFPTTWPPPTPATWHDLLNVGYILTSSETEEIEETEKAEEIKETEETEQAPEDGATLILANSQGQLWQRAQQPEYVNFSTQIRPSHTNVTANGFLTQLPDSYQNHPLVAIETDDSYNYLAEAWPDLFQSSRYEIGTTSTQSPVDLSVLSGGQSGYSAILVDGVTVTPQQRGLLVVTIDATTGQHQVTNYDTYASETASDQFSTLIESLPTGTIVAVAIYDEGTAKLTKHAHKSLSMLGAETNLSDKFGQAYALIGVKGATVGTAMEALGQTAQILDVGLGAKNPTPANFTSQLLSYQPNQIRLLVETDTIGLMSLSEPDYPGWHAYIDGQPTPIIRTNHIFRGIVLPAGQHEVVFVYNPLSFRLGGGISILFLVVTIGMFGVGVIVGNNVSLALIISENK